MHFQRFQSVRSFADFAIPTLEMNEAENNLPIGILNRALDQEEEPIDWLMACVFDGENVPALIAMMTPPHNLILSASSVCPDPAVECLIAALKAEDVSIPGTIAESGLARAFAKRWGKPYRVQMHERIYRLERVNNVPMVGTLRPVRMSDMPFLPYWLKAAHEEMLCEPSELSGDRAQEAIESGKYCVLEVNGIPVSLAGTARRTAHGCSIGPVYTPPYNRNHGYATSCVAALSRQQLQNGARFCALFTDLANPVSNSIYQKIGYHPIQDVDALVWN